MKYRFSFPYDILRSSSRDKNAQCIILVVGPLVQSSETLCGKGNDLCVLRRCHAVGLKGVILCWLYPFIVSYLLHYLSSGTSSVTKACIHLHRTSNIFLPFFIRHYDCYYNRNCTLILILNTATSSPYHFLFLGYDQSKSKDTFIPEHMT